MNTYHQNSPCPKCGAHGAGVKYHAKGITGNCDGLEHMHRDCKACSYEWSEAPLTTAD